MRSLPRYFKYTYFLAALALMVLTSSCSIKKYIPEDQYLLNKVKIKGQPKAYDDDIYNLVRQKPNNKVLGIIKPNMWFYLWASEKRKAMKREEKLSKGSWEEPVLLDSSLIDASAEQMEAFLFSQGYFHADATYKVKATGRKAKVIYRITHEDPYRINRVDYNFADDRIPNVLTSDTSKTLLYPGVRYSGDLLTAERDRITRVLRNNGYYNFSREYIFYEVDSALDGKFVNVGLRVSNPPGQAHHKVYKIQNIYVEPQFKVSNWGPKDTMRVSDILFIGEHERVKPKVIVNQIYFKRGELYEAADYQQTLNRLSQLKLFQFIDIQFVSDTLNRGDTALLHVYLRLTPLDRQEIVADYEINTTEESRVAISNASQRSFGTAVSFVYRHRNLFKRAVQLEVRPRFAVEIPSRVFSGASSALDTPSFEYGLSNSLIYPRLLLPFIKTSERSSALNWQTAINQNTIIETNRYFDRTTYNLNLTYYINKGNFRHFITPAEVSFVNTDFRSDTFARQVLLTRDPLLLNLFDQHIISDFRYTFMYNQPLIINPVSTHWTFRNTFEIGGNLPALVDNLFDKDTIGDRLTSELYEVTYYQYLKNEVEVRFYQPLFKKTLIALRSTVGVGLPYGNSIILPFEKRFSVGGANSMRAWQLRELGPGSFEDKDGVRFDNTGDIKMELNTEYRFPVYKWIKSAVFADIGNVWTYNSGGRPGAKFYADSFYRQIAVAGGVGLRLDFSFFVFRLDFALPVLDPALPEGNRYVLNRIDDKGWLRRNLNVGLGIGYPF